MLIVISLDECNWCLAFCVSLILRNVHLPGGRTGNHIQALAEGIVHWFLNAELPLLPCMEDLLASYLQWQAKTNTWMKRLSDIGDQKEDRLWRNLASGKFNLYVSTINEREKLCKLERTGKLLTSSFDCILEQRDIQGDSQLFDLLTEQWLLFVRTFLAFLAMSQALERSINLWRFTDSDTASVLLSEVREKF